VTVVGTLGELHHAGLRVLVEAVAAILAVSAVGGV
jgi:hypothetical protein